MMAALDFLENIDLSDRGTQVMIAGGVLVTGLVLARLRGGDPAPEEGTAIMAASGFGSRSDADSILGNSPGVIGWVGNANPMPAQPSPATPASVLDTIFRNGKSIQVTRAPESSGVTCPAGYIAVQQPGEPLRCSLVDDRLKKDGQRTSFIPDRGETAYLDGSGAAQTNVTAAAGAGTINPDTNPIGVKLAGLGGFSPLPAAIAGAEIARIEGGESIQKFAGRVYGDESYWPQLIRRNPALALDAKLSAGDVLRTL